MKKSLIFRLLIVLPFVLTACNKSDDVELDFEITFPEGWINYVYSEEGRVMDAARVAENASDTLPESLVIFRRGFPSSTTALYYATLKPQIIASPSFDSVLYESDTLVNTINFKKLLSREHLTYIEDLSRDTVEITAITERYFTYHNEFGYNLTFVALDTTFKAAKVNFDNIIGTFRFKE